METRVSCFLDQTRNGQVGAIAQREEVMGMRATQREEGWIAVESDEMNEDGVIYLACWW